MPIKVAIASKNPVKIESARLAFTKIFPKESFDFHGFLASSNVSVQPLGEKETLTGAKNRVINLSKTIKADYYIGIEGGVKLVGKSMETFAWVVIKSKNKFSKSRTASFYLPQKIIDLVDQGKELGEADDIIFNRKNSKQSNGSVGILTDDVVTRTSYYEQAVVMALIPFKNPDLY
jgi:inosine/xanthosine triphosphatase